MMNARQHTTARCGPDLRPVTTAAVAASLLMLLLGLAHLALAARLTAGTAAQPLTPDVLQRLPLQMGIWDGVDVPLDDAIVRRTDTDALINRRYSRGGLESVSLYVGCGVRTRDMMVHRPEVCYIGAGWTRTGRNPRDVLLPDGAMLPCTVFEFSRGALNTARLVVLYYYIVDGQYCRDLSDWQYRFWRIGYVGQVQIAVSADTMPVQDAVSIALEFGAHSAPQILGLFHDMKAP